MMEKLFLFLGNLFIALIIFFIIVPTFFNYTFATCTVETSCSAGGICNIPGSNTAAYNACKAVKCCNTAIQQDESPCDWFKCDKCAKTDRALCHVCPNLPECQPTNTPVPSPTFVPTKTPTPTIPAATVIPSSPVVTETIPSVTPPSGCGKKGQGDANCDGVINDADYRIWMKEFDVMVPPMPMENNANFSCKEGNNSTYFIDLVDFEIWRRHTSSY